MKEINLIKIKTNKIIHQMNNGLAYYNYKGIYFKVFENIWDAKEWLNIRNNKLVIAEFENKEKLNKFIESYEKKCLYCGNRQKNIILLAKFVVLVCVTIVMRKWSNMMDTIIYH